jgi:hypothetical protein
MTNLEQLRRLYSRLFPLLGLLWSTATHLAFAQAIPGNVPAASALRPYFGGNLRFSPSGTPESQSWIWMPGSQISGTAGPYPYRGNPSLLKFDISYDTVDTLTSGGGYLNAMYVRDAAGTGHNGGRDAVWAELDVVGSPSTTGTNYLAAQFQTNVNANLGGTSGTYAGNVFGIDSNVFTGDKATNLAFITGIEVGTGIYTGSSAGNRFGIDIAAAGNVRGLWDDAALSIRGSATATWKYGIEFGGAASSWSLGADSTIIGATPRSHGGTDSPVALNGVDFRNVTFQSGGYAFATTGWSIDPSGNENVNTVTLRKVTSGAGANVAAAAAPGTGKLTLEVVAGTTSGTCKIIAYAGTSTTPVTIVDNVGSGC